MFSLHIARNTLSLFLNVSNAVTGQSVTFTTAATSPAIAMYQDNEGGTDSITIQDYLSDDPYTTAIVVDPSDSNNSALQVDKSTSNWGWSSLHYELDNPIDFSKGTVLSFKIKSADASKAWGWTRLKIANQKEDGGSSKETDDSQFLANDEWQTVYFNFDFPSYVYETFFIFILSGVKL